jgi:hypothetical protein
VVFPEEVEALKKYLDKEEASDFWSLSWMEGSGLLATASRHPGTSWSIR